MSEFYSPERHETQQPQHPLFDIARQNLQEVTAAMLRGKFNVQKEYANFYRQLQSAFPELYKSRQFDPPKREIPLILAVCQKAPGGILLDDYFVAIPFNIETEETRRTIREGDSLVATMYGDIIGAKKAAVIYTRFLRNEDRTKLARYFNPE